MVISQVKNATVVSRPEAGVTLAAAASRAVRNQHFAHTGFITIKAATKGFDGAVANFLTRVLQR